MYLVVYMKDLRRVNQPEAVLKTFQTREDAETYRAKITEKQYNPLKVKVIAST